MEDIKLAIIGFDWNDEKKGRAINRLTPETVAKLSGLPSGVVEAALEEILASGKGLSGLPAFLPGEYGPNITSEGILGRLNQTYFSRRLSTVDGIFKMVLDKGVVLLRAPPRSGKTSLCQLAVLRAQDKHIFDDVHFVRCIGLRPGGNTTFEQLFKEQCKVTFAAACQTPSSSPTSAARVQPSSSRTRASGSGSVLIVIDEAQQTYDPGTGSVALWDKVKLLGSTDQTERRLYFLLAASRGSNPSVSNLSSTPVELRLEQTVPMRHDSGGSRPSIQFTPEEFNEVLASFGSYIGRPAEELSTLGDIIDDLTERYPGTVVHILDELCTRYSSHHSMAAGHLVEEYINFVVSAKLLDTLTIRSFPESTTWRSQRGFVSLLETLLHNPSGMVDITDLQNNQGAQEEYHEAVEKSRAGWLQLEGNMLSFVSSLHRDFYAYNLARLVYASVGEMPGTLQEFLSMAIRRMHWHPLSRSKSVSFHDRAVHEAHYQHELYRGITSLLPHEAWVSPSVGVTYGVRAFCDFIIDPQRWAVEVLRDGSKVGEHLERFQPGGRYDSMIQDGHITSWAVVDIRCPGASKPRIRHDPNLYHVVFSEDFRTAVIRHGGGSEETVHLAS